MSEVKVSWRGLPEPKLISGSMSKKALCVLTFVDQHVCRDSLSIPWSCLEKNATDTPIGFDWHSEAQWTPNTFWRKQWDSRTSQPCQTHTAICHQLAWISLALAHIRVHGQRAAYITSRVARSVFLARVVSRSWIVIITNHALATSLHRRVVIYYGNYWNNSRRSRPGEVI